MANIAHTEVYSGFTIEYTNNAHFGPGEEPHAIHVLKLGIDAGYFSGSAAGEFNRLRIIGGVHPYTVHSNTGAQVPEPAHLTVQGYTNGQGRWKTHIWTLPINATCADANTTLNPSKPIVFIKC